MPWLQFGDLIGDRVQEGVGYGMKLEDCTPGRHVQIAGRWLLTQLNSMATVLDTRPAPAHPEDNPAYPHGMVQVRLDPAVIWGCREPWIGPEDLGFAPGDRR